MIPTYTIIDPKLVIPESAAITAHLNAERAIEQHLLAQRGEQWSGPGSEPSDGPSFLFARSHAFRFAIVGARVYYVGRYTGPDASAGGAPHGERRPLTAEEAEAVLRCQTVTETVADGPANIPPELRDRTIALLVDGQTVCQWKYNPRVQSYYPPDVFAAACAATA